LGFWLWDGIVMMVWFRFGHLLELMYRIVMIGSVSDVFLLNAYRDALNWRAWVLAWVRRLYVSLGFRFVWNEAWLF
jgi:hypothetical protein